MALHIYFYKLDALGYYNTLTFHHCSDRHVLKSGDESHDPHPRLRLGPAMVVRMVSVCRLQLCRQVSSKAPVQIARVRRLDSPPYMYAAAGAGTPILHPQNNSSPPARVTYCPMHILTIMKGFFGVGLP